MASILAESALRRPDKTAVVSGDVRLTYGQVWDAARRAAAVLRERGVGRGDRVALLLPNVPHFPIAYYAVEALGAVVVPVHALLKAEEVEFVLRDSGAALLVCAGPLLGEGAKGAELAGVPVLQVLDGPGGTDSGVERLEPLLAQVEPIEAIAQVGPEDDAVILYTSGTTGQPKGAVLSQLNLVMNAAISATDVAQVCEDDVILGCLPLFHTFGQTCCMNAGFRAGATVVLMPRFTGPAALDLLVREKVTIFMGVPTMYLGLLEAAKSDERRPHLKLATSGGAALPLTAIEAFKEVFDADIYEGYGLSETSPVATFNQQVFGRKPGTVGHPVWGVEVQVARADVDERIELLPRGELGEIVVRGHNIMKGYLNLPDATAAAIVDGWFRTGDLGTVDDDGFVAIVDRKKDMVLRGGYNVYPREVEEVLLRHQAIDQVAVIAVPDPQYGEEICAVIVPTEGNEPGDALAGQIRDWAKERLAAYKYPRKIEFIEALPLGPSGKVLKRELVAQYR